MTASHSPSSMLTSMRSRRMPALFTSVSRCPKVSIARWTMRPAPAKSATFSPSATASPPIALISSTTSIAGLSEPPSPCMSPPRSFTTTFAPSRANASACSRPMPRPEPVTMTTRPSQIPMLSLCLPELLPQLMLVELAVVVPGQSLDEDHVAGTLVVRDAVPAPLDQVVRERIGRFDARLRLHCGDHDLAPFVVGPPDHADVADRGVGEQHRFDLGGVHIHATGDDEVGAAVGEEQVSVIVDVAHVAEREVRAPVRTLGLLGRLEVFEPVVVGRPQVDGADTAGGELIARLVEDPYVVGRVDPSDRARLAQPLGRTDERARTLGCRVVLPHDRAEPRHESLLDVDRTRSGA